MVMYDFYRKYGMSMYMYVKNNLFKFDDDYEFQSYLTCFYFTQNFSENVANITKHFIVYRYPNVCIITRVVSILIIILHTKIQAFLLSIICMPKNVHEGLNMFPVNLVC